MNFLKEFRLQTFATKTCNALPALFFFLSLKVLKSSLFAPSPFQVRHPIERCQPNVVLFPQETRALSFWWSILWWRDFPRGQVTTCCLWDLKDWLCSIQVPNVENLIPVHQIQVRYFWQKTKGNCPFCEQNTLRQEMYCIFQEWQSQTKPEQSFLGDGTVKTIPHGKKRETSPRSFPQHCCWKECCASIPSSTVAGAGFSWHLTCASSRIWLSMASGDRTGGQVPGRNGSIKTQTRKKTAAWFLTLKYFN